VKDIFCVITFDLIALKHKKKKVCCDYIACICIVVPVATYLSNLVLSSAEMLNSQSLHTLLVGRHRKGIQSVENWMFVCLVTI